jgi:hypothetical protein
VISASEDIGLADPQALVIAVAADAVAFIGMPEGRILAEATAYLATTAKSTPPRDRRGDRRRARGRLRAGAAASATRTTRAPSGSATARATSTRTTSRSASPRSSTCRTSCAGATTASRPDAGSNATSRRASRRSARSWATERVEGAVRARQPAGADVDDGRRARSPGAAHRDQIYDGYTRVRRDTYRLPDGSVSDWDVLDQGDTVAVIAFTDTGDALLFEQFRVGRALMRELPGGLIDTGEMLSSPARASCSRRRASRRGPVPRRERVVGSQLDDARTVVVAAGCRRVADPHWEDGETGVVRTIGIDELVAHLLAGGLSDAGEAARGLLVFTRASVADPVLRRAGSECAPRWSVRCDRRRSLIPLMSSHCSGIASIRRTRDGARRAWAPPRRVWTGGCPRRIRAGVAA